MKKYIVICIVCFSVYASGFEGESDLAFLPQDISGVFAIALKKTNDLRFTDELRGKAEHVLSVFNEMTGVEIKKTDSVTCAVQYPSGTVPDDRKKIKEYIILHGSFNPKDIITRAERSKKYPLKITEYEKISLIHTKNGSHAFCFLDRTRLAAGSLECVKEMIDVLRNKAQPAERSRDTSLVKLPQESRTFLWGMCHASRNNRNTERSRNVGDMVQTCTNFGFEVNIKTEHYRNRPPVDFANITLIAKFRDIDIPSKVATGVRKLKNQVENLKRYAHTHGIDMRKHRIGFHFLDSMNVVNRGNTLLFKIRCTRTGLRHHLRGSYVEELLDILTEGLKENTHLKQVIKDDQKF